MFQFFLLMKPAQNTLKPHTSWKFFHDFKDTVLFSLTSALVAIPSPAPSQALTLISPGVGPKSSSLSGYLICDIHWISPLPPMVCWLTTLICKISTRAVSSTFYVAHFSTAVLLHPSLLWSVSGTMEKANSFLFPLCILFLPTHSSAKVVSFKT